MEKINKRVNAVGVSYISVVGSFHFILEFLLYYRKDNIVISVIRSLFSY